MKFDVAKRAGDRAAVGFEVDADVSGLAGVDIYVLRLDLVAVVDDSDAVLACAQRNRLISFADGLAVNEQVGLLRGDLDLQLTVLSEAGARAERDSRHEGEQTSKSSHQHFS